MRFGYALSSEEFTPRELLKQTRWAEGAGFTSFWISDHYHPWTDEQGNSPFVWSVIGAMSQLTDLPITTAVTCPTVRIHPAVLAQAAATSAVLCGGNFVLGVGSGEALNEHILGDPWPPAETRLAMLEEAVEVMRELWRGEQMSHDGEFYTVVNARLYTLPEEPPKVYMSGFGPKSVRLAGRISDGFITTSPDSDLVALYRESGGEGKPVTASLKVCWDEDPAQARKTIHRLWPNLGLPGELSQVLPDPAHFEQAVSLVSEEKAAESVPYGPDPRPYAEAVEEYAKAGFDELYLQQIGPRQEEFFGWAEDVLLPELARIG